MKKILKIEGLFNCGGDYKEKDCFDAYVELENEIYTGEYGRAQYFRGYCVDHKENPKKLKLVFGALHNVDGYLLISFYRFANLPNVYPKLFILQSKNGELEGEYYGVWKNDCYIHLDEKENPAYVTDVFELNSEEDINIFKKEFKKALNQNSKMMIVDDLVLENCLNNRKEIKSNWDRCESLGQCKKNEQHKNDKTVLFCVW